MLNGRQYISVYKPIKTRDGTVAGMLFVGKTMDSIKDVSSRIFMTVVPGMAILTLVLLGCFVFLVRFVITNPLRKIGDAVHNLASGNADLTYRIGVSGGDEIGVIARDINTFMEMQQALMRDVLRAQKSLSEIGGMMSTHALSTADSVERIMTNVQDVRTLSGRQSASVRRTDGVVATSIASVGSLNSLIERQTVGITESSAAIEEMVGNIASVNASVQKMSSKFGELISTTEGGKTKLSDVDVRVSKIAEQSSMLMEANRVIAQIASQTNLLAMNAAIEAAHAGSAGAGFSVVADEIRKLAENSARQSKAINAELKRIFASIEDVVRSSSQSGLAFGEIVGRLGETDGLVREIADAMREQMAASTQILGALRDMNASSCDVLEESRKLGTGVRTVEAEMREVTGLTAGVSSNMDGIFSGLEEINASSRGVSVLAVATTDNIRAMGEISGKFLVE
jgi:methyl-accepting chemotaxis protein